VNVPVATVAIGRTGAINSAYLAIQILALEDKVLAEKLIDDRIEKVKKVESDSLNLETIL